MIDNNEKYHGAVVHFVVPELDDGPVIIQYQCEVDKNDDHHSLQKKCCKVSTSSTQKHYSGLVRIGWSLTPEIFS